MEKEIRFISEEEVLLVESSELMNNIHAYDSEIFGRINATLEGMKEGKTYSISFINVLLFEAMDLFENTHSDETDIYFKLEKRLG